MTNQPNEPLAIPHETYQSAADCPLGAAHGLASTHGNAVGEDCCDFCGFPATQPREESEPSGGAWTAKQVPEENWETPGCAEFDVTMPDGSVFECIAVDEEDAIREAQDHNPHLAKSTPPPTDALLEKAVAASPAKDGEGDDAYERLKRLYHKAIRDRDAAIATPSLLDKAEAALRRIAGNAEQLAIDKSQSPTSVHMWELCRDEARATLAEIERERGK